MTMDDALAVVNAYLSDQDSRYLAEDVTLDLVWEDGVRRGRAAVATLAYDLRHRRLRDVSLDVTGLVSGPGQVLLEVELRPLRGQVLPTIAGRAAVLVHVTGGEIRAVRVYCSPRPVRLTAGVHARAG